MLTVMLAFDCLRLLLLGSGGMLDKLFGEKVIDRLIENGSRMQPTEQMYGLKDVAVLGVYYG